MKEYKITVDLNDRGKKLLNKDKFEITRNFEDIPDLDGLYNIVKEECPAELFNKQSICIRFLDNLAVNNFKKDDVVRMYVNENKWVFGHITYSTGDNGYGWTVFVRCPSICAAVKSGRISRDEISRWGSWDSSRDFEFAFDARTGLDMTRKKYDKWHIVLADEAETKIYGQETKKHKLIDQILMTAVTYYKEVVDNGNYSFMEDLINCLDREGVIEKVSKIFDMYRDDYRHFDGNEANIYQFVKTFDEMWKTDIEDFDCEFGINYDRC